MNVKQAVPFFMVRDMNASLRFYVDGLGFRITHRWDVEGRLCWCWLVLDSVSLMLQEYNKPPDDKLGVGVSVCFICEDAIALYHDFRSRQVNVKKPFVGNNMWVSSVVDPDGYRLDF